MDMPEMGAVGGAEVLSVSSAPPIQSGKGNVVSGKFIHEVANCIDLHIEGHDNPIGCTDNHPFWSEDRQEFIPAGELNQGERVLLYSGETARIAQKLPRPGPETVYNLEIWGEHVYHVGNDGVLVHNACTLSELQRYEAYWKHHAPEQSKPFDMFRRYNPDGSLKQVTLYNEFGKRQTQYDIADPLRPPHQHSFDPRTGKRSSHKSIGDD